MLMNSRLLLCCAEFASGLPYLAVVAILIHYFLRRAAWRRRKRQGKTAGFCPSSAAMGVIFLFAQTFCRPAVSYEIEARLVERTEEDDDGDPETPAIHLGRQLRRIRRGEQVETLVLHL
jgi:hypothetical protein